jgi:hypothetical protein
VRTEHSILVRKPERREHLRDLDADGNMLFVVVRVNGVRISVQTVATNRPIVHPPGDM